MTNAPAAESPGDSEPFDEPRRKRYARTLLLWMLAGYWIALFVATHVPPRGVPRVVQGVDKLAHLVAYGGLSFLLCTMLWARAWETSRILVLVIPTVLLYGVADEFLQQFVGRTADFWDWVADAAGTVIGCGCFTIARNILGRIFTR